MWRQEEHASCLLVDRNDMYMTKETCYLQTLSLDEGNMFYAIATYIHGAREI